ncbi:hypothetical protein I6H88_20065 [Elizabethkingia bruuniana]|uniref:HTH luxR-type domain-containing protein n=1 Tax=Elizabethkingia bruuniana TaxID=1756149 RepID=A0A7T7ZYK6_9FLAO|nr:hypothetical protein [Elizabethkingia bruuniana]KGO09526.1 hypothetical protein KS04_13670 [Elizabethkingia miricola]AQX85198.1 hypothetical protein AYC65_09340 [Elizabethkingia bruuniana]KUY28615.1 hypothetical protein ATB97_00330 [Elizabethkingia bruuniana]OPB70245.1 hypothetical protein BAY12_16440 [Elizabethkingia bruuniana]QQN58690.1 hypothetical protein I6H88_20065 [Elizabethkingia bruuniana]
MQRNLLLLFLVALFTIMYGQSKKEKEIDSIFNTIKSGTKNPYVKNETNKALEICEEVYHMSKEINYVNGQIDALSYMAEIYANTGNTKMSLVKADEAIILASRDKKYIMDYSTLLIVKGTSLSKLGYFERALQVYQEAINVADKAPAKYNNQKHYNKALTYFLIILSHERDQEDPLSKKELEFYVQSAYKEALQITSDYPQKAYIMTKSLQGLISAYTDWGEFDKAEKHIAEGDKINKNTISTWDLTRNVLQGSIETKRKNFTKAVEHYEIALKLTKAYKLVYDQKLLYALLAENYHELHDYKNESHYLAHNKRLSDSLSKVEKQASNYILKDEVKKKTKQKELETNTIIYYSSALVFILFITGYFVYKQSKKSKTQFSVLNEKAEIDIEDNDDHKRLNQLIEIAESNNSTFYLKFQEVFPDFNQALLNINQKLTQSDLEYCAMMKLNFDTKKIATIKKNSVGAVESKKHRIRKKLNITSEENIYIWLIDK